MRRLFKIILIVLLVFIVVFAVVGIVLFGDVAGAFAGGSETLSPSGEAVGKALVVYNPGLSGAAQNAATKIAERLQSSDYEVVLAGVSSAAAGNTSGYAVIVVGGPIYAGKPTASVQGYLNKLNPPANAVVGVFGIGDGPADSDDPAVIASEVAPLPSDNSVTLKTVMKISNKENLDARCTEFTTALHYFYLAAFVLRLRE
jgi:flavodoxin